MADTAVPALALDDEDDLGKSDEAPSPRLSDLLDTAPGPVLSIDTVDVPEDYGPLSPLTSLDSDSEHEQDVEDDDDVPLAEKARSNASQSRAGRRAAAVPSASRNTGKRAANRGRNTYKAATRAATYRLRSHKKAQNYKPAMPKTQMMKKPPALVATAPKMKVKRGLNRLQLAKIAAEQDQAVEDEQESEDGVSDHPATVPLARDQRQDRSLPRQTLDSNVDAATHTPQQPAADPGHGASPTTTVPVPDGALAAAVAQASSTTTAPENDTVPALFVHRSNARLALLPIAHAALPPVLANQLPQTSEDGTAVNGIDALPTDTSSSSHAAAAISRSSPTPLTFAMSDSAPLAADATSSRSPAMLRRENAALPSLPESTTRASSTGSDISFSLGPAERAKRSPRKARTTIPMFADPARYKAFAAREAKARKAEQAAKKAEKAKTTRGKARMGKRIAAAKTNVGEPAQEVGVAEPAAEDPRSNLSAAHGLPPPQPEVDATLELQATRDEVGTHEQQGSTPIDWSHVRRVNLIVSDPPTPVSDVEPEPVPRKSTRERKAVQRFVVEVHQPKPRGPKPAPVPLDTTPRRSTRAHPSSTQILPTPSVERGKRKAADAQLDEPRGKRARRNQSEDEDEDGEPSPSRTRRGKRISVTREGENTIDEGALVQGTAGEQLQVATPPVTPAKRKRGPAATKHDAPEDPDSPIKRTRTATKTLTGGMVQQLPMPAPSPTKRGRKRKALDELQTRSPSKRARAAPGADVEQLEGGVQLDAGASQRTWQLFGAESTSPLKLGPLPDGLRPLLWTKTRQEICENLAWFRTYQGGVYHRDGLAIGYLLGGHAAPRDAFLHDGKVIISHGGGGTAVKAVIDQATNETVKKRVLVQDQTVSKSGIHARVLRKALEIGQPLLVLADSKYALFPHTLKEEVGYYVLGWYCVKDTWAEAEKSGSGNDAHTRVKVCLQWIETQGEPWWIPQPPSTREVTLESNPQGLPTPPLDAHPITLDAAPRLPQKIAQLSLPDLTKRAVEPVDIASCTSCKTTSKIVYDVGWMCLTSSCARFWTLPTTTTTTPTGTDASPHGQGMQYLPSFTELVPSPPLARLYAQNTDYRPKFPELLDKENGDPTTVHFQRGGCCPDCGRVFLRSKWECWECPTPGCTFRKAVDWPIQKASKLAPPGGVSPTGTYKITDSSIRLQTFPLKVDSKGGVATVNAFHLPEGRGIIYQVLGNSRVNKEADEIFEQYQNDYLEKPLFRRYPLASTSIASEMLTQYFSQNSGVPYKYIATVDQTIPFDRSPRSVNDALALIRQRATLLVPDAKFNELLTAGYLGSQQMNYRAFLALLNSSFGIIETVSLCHADSDFERGLGNDVAALSLGSPAQMRFKYRPPKPKPGQEKSKDRVVLEFTLNHGDVLIMHGLGVQENYQHMVSPEGFRIAATARWIDRDANESEPTARPRGKRVVAPAAISLDGAVEFDAGAAASVDAALAIEVPAPVPIASPEPEAGGHTVHTYSPGAYAEAVEEFALPLHDTAAADDFARSFDHAADELSYLFGRDWMPRQAWTAWETADQFPGPSNEESSATPRMAWEFAQTPDQLGDEGMRSIADIRAMSP